MMLYKQDCLNCKKTFDLKATDPDSYRVLFCCVECKDTYYENEVLKKAEELDIDVPIENRWDILDL